MKPELSGLPKNPKESRNMKPFNALPLAALIAAFLSTAPAFAGPPVNGASNKSRPQYEPAKNTHTIAVSVHGKGIGQTAEPTTTPRHYSPRRWR